MEWAIVASPAPGLITPGDDGMTSGLSTTSIFVPQEAPFDNVVTIAMWGAASTGDAAPLLTLQFLHPLTDDTPLGERVIGALYYFEGGADWGWGADFEGPDAEITVDSYTRGKNQLAIRGHFSARLLPELGPGRTGSLTQHRHFGDL
ncbi:hypothetical protein [Breoghania corrubedonensis]|uniref:hypothetical protein n=1 Tax=Breoghania corrubedonensis TaxID=665038 RepID=UPI0011B1E1ED|nr:hypothetical protein [Breoghania corrubedonensis]